MRDLANSGALDIKFKTMKKYYAENICQCVYHYYNTIVFSVVFYFLLYSINYFHTNKLILIATFWYIDTARVKYVYLNTDQQSKYYRSAKTKE